MKNLKTAYKAWASTRNEDALDYQQWLESELNHAREMLCLIYDEVDFPPRYIAMGWDEGFECPICLNYDVNHWEMIKHADDCALGIVKKLKG